MSTSGTGSEETVQAAAAPQPGGESASVDSLSGTTWALFAYGETNALQAMVADSEVTMAFGDEGDLTGNAGCNRFMTTFAVEDGLMRTGPIGLTRMMCVDQAVQAQEATVVAALESMSEGRPFRLIDNQLEIQLADGTLLVFVAQ